MSLLEESTLLGVSFTIIKCMQDKPIAQTWIIMKFYTQRVYIQKPFDNIDIFYI